MMLMGLAAVVGGGAYPMIRHMAKRLERLQQGVESLGSSLTSVTLPVAREPAGALADAVLSVNFGAAGVVVGGGAGRTWSVNDSTFESGCGVPSMGDASVA